MARPTTWILTEGLAGTEAPCRGLARALGIDPVIKRIRLRRPWDWLPGQFWIRPFAALAPDGDSLVPPWPELVISSGNAAAPLALAIQRASGGGKPGGPSRRGPGQGGGGGRSRRPERAGV